jgi:hypothetical protein
MDFMVAARGYSMANGFLLAAVAIAMWYAVSRRLSLTSSCLLASAALGLSLSANFSFGIVDTVACLAQRIRQLDRHTCYLNDSPFKEADASRLVFKRFSPPRAPRNAWQTTAPSRIERRHTQAHLPTYRSSKDRTFAILLRRLDPARNARLSL